MKANELIQAIEYMKIKYGNDIEIESDEVGALSIKSNGKFVDLIEIMFYIPDENKIKE